MKGNNTNLEMNMVIRIQAANEVAFIHQSSCTRTSISVDHIDSSFIKLTSDDTNRLAHMKHTLGTFELLRGGTSIKGERIAVMITQSTVVAVSQGTSRRAADAQFSSEE